MNLQEIKQFEVDDLIITINDNLSILKEDKYCGDMLTVLRENINRLHLLLHMLANIDPVATRNKYYEPVVIIEATCEAIFQKNMH